jgi:hypothetical protein
MPPFASDHKVCVAACEMEIAVASVEWRLTGNLAWRMTAMEKILDRPVVAGSCLMNNYTPVTAMSAWQPSA